MLDKKNNVPYMLLQYSLLYSMGHSALEFHKVHTSCRSETITALHFPSMVEKWYLVRTRFFLFLSS